MSESKFYHFTSSGSFYCVATIDDVVEESKGAGFVWFNFYRPSKEELSSLIDKIGIHPLSVEDCFDDRQVPKIEYFTGNTFIIFNAYTYSGETLYIDEINLFIGKNYLITVSGHNSGSRSPLEGLTAIIENGRMNSYEGPDFLMHKVIDYLVDQKYKAFDDLEDELEEAEDFLIDNVEKFQPRQLIRIRKTLQVLRKSLYYEREILVKISRKDCPFISEKALVHYRDIYDHLAKFFELTETYREIETSLMELYTSLLNNLMTRSSNETNASVRRLTLITTVFMPLTLLASIGGMSEWSMITGPENWKVSYPLFLIGMGLIALLNFLLLRRLEKKGNPFSSKNTEEEKKG